MQGLENILIQNVSAVAMAVAFIWYLINKDKRNGEVFRQLNKSLQNITKTIMKHGDKDIIVQKEITEALTQLGDLIHVLCREVRKK